MGADRRTKQPAPPVVRIGGVTVRRYIEKERIMRAGFRRMRTVVVALLTGSALLVCAAAAAAAPVIGSDCGAGASIVGTDSAGKVTLGAGARDTNTCTLTFASPAANAPACVANNETNGGGYSVPVGTKSTTTTVLIGGARPWSDHDVIGYVCVTY